MDPIEKEICLRVINKVIDTFEKIKIDTHKQLEPSTQENSLSVPTWLLRAEDELKSGGVMKLCTIINMIKQDLRSYLKKLGPFLAIFCGVIYIEQVLNEEIHNLPRKLRYYCSERQNKPIRKRKGAGNNAFLNSSILIDTLRDMVKSETDSSNKESSKIEEINQRNESKLTEIELKILPEAVKNDNGNKKDNSCKETITQRANRKRRKSTAERVSLEGDKQCPSLTNLKSRTLRSGVKILEEKERGSKKDSRKRSNNINQYPQDPKTATVIPIEDKKVSRRIQPTEVHHHTSVKKKQKIIEPGNNDDAANKSQGNLIQTATSSKKFICQSNTDDKDLRKKANKLSSNINCEIKQVSLEPGNQSIEKDHSRKNRITQSKRNLPLRGKRALKAKECENSKSSKKLKHNEAKGITICPSSTKNSKRSDGKEDRKKLSESTKIEETKPREEKDTIKNTDNSDLGITKVKGIHELMGEDEEEKSFLNELVKSIGKEISPFGDQSNNIGVNKTNLFEEIENYMEQEKRERNLNSLILNANIPCPGGKSLPSFEQESPNSRFLEGDLETISMKYPNYMYKQNEGNINVLPAGNKSTEVNCNFTRMIIECYHKDEHWKATTLKSDDKYESLKHMPQALEVSCFLHACQKVLHLPFFTHFEFEWAMLIPQASQLMAVIMTALLNASPASKKEKRCAALPYLEWNRKLTARISHWFFIQSRIKNSAKVCNLIGIEPTFWEFIGTPRNPLSQRPFHQLTICQRVIIIKALCDHLLHVSKRIQTAIISTPNNGRESVFLGRDARGNLFIFFPILLRCGKGDIRIYEMEEYSLNGREKQIQETISENNGTSRFSHFYTVECFCKDRRFRLVADDIYSLDSLAEKICSYHSEEEFYEAEKRLSEEKSNKTEEKGEQNMDNKEEDHAKELEEIEDSDLFPSCEHLKLALNINILAKSLWPHQQTLKKSRAAAKAKLAAEWEEYSKDRLNAMDKGEIEHKTKIVRHPTNHHILLKNPVSEASKEGQQKTPTRVSLSRKVKCKLESPLTEVTKTLSRREIVTKMEEDALMGKSSASEEEKWEPNLWADEESEDEETPTEEDLDWNGYEAFQNNPWQFSNTNKKEIKEEIVKENRSNLIKSQEAAKTYTRILMVKSVKDSKDETTLLAAKDDEQLKRNVKAFNIVSKPVSLSTGIVKERYLIPAERYKTNIVQTMKHKNQDRSFGKLHFNVTDDFEQLCYNPTLNFQGIKIDSERVTMQSSKHAPESFWRMKTHEELSNNLEIILNSERKAINKEQENKVSLLSHIENQEEKLIHQLHRDVKEKNVRKEQYKFSNSENNSDNEDRKPKIKQDEETRTFKPFPLRSIVLRNAERDDLANVNKVFDVE